MALGVSSMAFPPAKVVAGWWRQLASSRPRSLWVGYWFVQRAEALVHLVAPHTLDRLSSLLLQAIRLEALPAKSEPMQGRLQERLHFPLPILMQLLRNLSELGLVENNTGDWCLTDLGQSALADGSFPQPQWQRMVFSFLEHLDANDQRLRLPHFIALGEQRGQAWHPPDACDFQIDWLTACLDQPDAWKEAHGFPGSVRKIMTLGQEAESWKGVVVVRPERLGVVLVENANESLSAYAFKPDGWMLSASLPLTTFPTDVRAELGELTPAVSDEDARAAWRHFCHAHKIAETDADQCDLAIHDNRLEVRPPSSLRPRLASVKGDDVVLLGSGTMRRAGAVVLAEAG